ncbi:MAG: hypothetical protein CLLPBCKN_007172 [Chroococcidiopsis cubana SAG 39.79]|nr:hypothetical protein [Chroococcidiopsis cubana SAG 39.79]PSB65873.1 hypothetical protein C7B79_03410 [Chroococcidiopsis cubana CCALA 043]
MQPQRSPSNNKNENMLGQFVLCYLEGASVFLTMLVVKATGKETASLLKITRQDITTLRFDPKACRLFYCQVNNRT